MALSAAFTGVHEGALDQEGRPCVEIAARCAALAVRDAGLSTTDIDGVLAAFPFEEPSPMFASQVADAMGVEPSLAETVCFGGASPAMMVPRAIRAIENGQCEVVVLAAAGNRASKAGQAAIISGLRDVLNPEFEVPFGAFVPTVYALMATRFMHERGITEEQLAEVAVVQRRHACAHPNAAMRTPLSVAEVISSPVISTPLHRYDCCLVTDFGGAVVIESADRVRRDRREPVWISGTGEAHDRMDTSSVMDLTLRGSAKSSSLAFARAGLGPEELDVACLYDSFTITVLQTLENIGMVAEGSSGRAVADGEFSYGGRVLLNPNGGMLSYRTGGISHIIEALCQLRGEALGLSAEKPRSAIVHGIGGAMSSHCTVMLEKDGER